MEEIKQKVWKKFEEYVFFESGKCAYNKESKAFGMIGVDIEGKVITKEEAEKIVDKEIKKALKKNKDVLIYICKDEGLIAFEDIMMVVKQMGVSDFVKYSDQEADHLWIAWD